MARNVQPSRRRALPETRIVLDRFNRGMVTLVDESILFKNSAKESQNLIQKMDGRWSPRWGSDYYGVDAGDTIDGAAPFTTDAGATHLVISVAGTIKRSTDDGDTWDTCTGASLTSGEKVYFIQIGSYLYIANGTDSLVRYDGTTTLTTYTALSTPGAPSPVKTGLTGTTYTASYRVSAVNEVGETVGSTAGTVTIGKTRDNWTAGTDYITSTWTKVSNATGYNVYYQDDLNGSGQHVYVGSVVQPSGATVTFTDNGEASQPLNNFVVAPEGDTTSGPTFTHMELSGNRIWATLDPDNPWRVYWSGSGVNIGAFSPFNGGGYIDLEKGGRERPKAVVHYRDGKGGAFATVLTSDPEGVGSVWQISLESVSIGDTAFVVPSATKIVGSVGSDSPLSVVKVKDDIMFFNRKGWFNLGSRAQMLNLLSTDEISSNIRPTIQSMTGSALNNVCAYYYDAKVFCSMPRGNSTNNEIYINDTERKNWCGPWTVGVERFLQYSDTSGETHLLAVPIAGSRLIEFSENIEGDLSSAFSTRLLTGLYPVDENRNSWAKIRYAYIELNQPVGNITFSVLGTGKRDGYSQVGSISITDTVSNSGYSANSQLSNFLFSDTSVTPTVYSQASVKKRIRINKLLNNIQFKVTTDARGDAYTLLSISAKGYLIPTGDPQSWKS